MDQVIKVVKTRQHIRLVEVAAKQEDFFELVELLGISWALDTKKAHSSDYIRVELRGEIDQVEALVENFQGLISEKPSCFFELTMPPDWYYEFEAYMSDNLGLSEPAQFAFSIVDDQPATAWLTLPIEDEIFLRMEADRFSNLKQIPEP
jgi:hypothetical protein